MTYYRAWAVLTTLFALSATASPARAQSAEGNWEGKIVAGPNTLRVRLRLNRAADGLWSGTFDSVDQGATFPLDHIVVAGDSLRFAIAAVNGSYRGSLSGTRDGITGMWSQGEPAALSFTRAAVPAAVASTAAPQAPAVLPFGVPMDLDVRVPPTAFSAEGKTHLVYEVNITNLSGFSLLLRRVDVLGEGGTLLSLEAEALNAALARPGAPGLTDNRSVGPGMRAVVFVWVSLEPGAAVPTRIRHRVTVGEQSIEGGAVQVSSIKALTIGPPLRGTDWVAANGPGNSSAHRRALIPVEGMGHIAQRFAIDWVQRGDDGSTFTGDRLVNKNYHAYGTDVLAVAEGVISATKDGIPENVPGANSRAVPITLETVGGNHVIINLGGGRYAFYAHLQPGSLRVKVGDRVKKGQLIGLLGNSGNSTEPHLHFHISDGNSPLGSDGIPYLLETFEVVGGTKPGVRNNEQPLQNARVKFGAAR